MSRCNKK